MFEQPFSILFNAVEQIRLQLPDADPELRTNLCNELNRLHQTSAEYFDYWLSLDENIRSLADTYQLELFVDSIAGASEWDGSHPNGSYPNGSQLNGSHPNGTEPDATESDGFEPNLIEPDSIESLDASSLLHSHVTMRTGDDRIFPARGSLQSVAYPVEIEDVAFDLTDKSAYALRKGLAFYELLMFAQASASLSEVVESWDQPVARLYLSASHAALGQYPQALHHLSLVKQTATEAKMVCACLEIEAYIAIASEDVGHAADCFREITETLPAYTEALFNLAMCALANGDVEQAVYGLRAFCQQEPDDIDALEWLAYALYQQGQFTQSRGLCETTLQQTPRNFNLLSIACASCRKLNAYLDGIRFALRMVQVDPMHPQGYLHLAWFALKSADLETACSVLKKLLAIHPNHPDALLQSGIVSYLSDDLSRAEKTLLQAVTCKKNCALAWIALGRISAKQGRLQQAERRLIRAIRDKRPAIRRLALSLVAEACDACGRTEEANKYRQALADLGGNA